MKKRLPFFLSLIAAAFTLQAQPVSKTLKSTLQLKMPRTVDDDMPGTRGASIAWHPVQKKYYAAMAGNAGYPLAVFDMKGVLVSADELSTEQDVRGLWYNPAKKQIQGNTYNDGGLFYYTLNAKGIPLSNTVFAEGMNQPDEQTVGAFNTTRQVIYFLSTDKVFTYSTAGKSLDEGKKIHFGRTKADGPLEGELEDEFEEPQTPEDYNYTTVVYTGLKGQEFGFLNTISMEIELYDMASGFMTKKLVLPEDAAMNQSFNFSYANGMYWLFSIEERTWTGYK